VVAIQPERYAYGDAFRPDVYTKVDTLSTLGHELGHAVQATTIPDFFNEYAVEAAVAGSWAQNRFEWYPTALGEQIRYDFTYGGKQLR
jgi:hypothetical protein